LNITTSTLDTTKAEAIEASASVKEENNDTPSLDTSMDQHESSSSSSSSSSSIASSQSTQDTSMSTSNPSSTTTEEHNTVKPVVVDLDNLSLSDDDSETTDDSSSETETESGSEDEEAPAPNKASETTESPPKVYTGPAIAEKFFVGTATTPGTNRYNEDRAVILPAFGGRPTHAYFGVYDGHGGTKCSDFCMYILFLKGPPSLSSFFFLPSFLKLISYLFLFLLSKV
jgi:hypothetical protein